MLSKNLYLRRASIEFVILWLHAKMQFITSLMVKVDFSTSLVESQQFVSCEFSVCHLTRFLISHLKFFFARFCENVESL